MPTDLPMFATVANARKCCGKYGVIISMNELASYTTLDVNLNRLTSLSKVRPKFAATDSLPNLPNPSLSTQFTAAAAGSVRLAPNPTAVSICCVAKTEIQLDAMRCANLNLAYSQ